VGQGLVEEGRGREGGRGRRRREEERY